MGKPWSTHNIQITPIDVHTKINYDHTPSLPSVKATTVLELSDVAYFVQDSPDVIYMEGTLSHVHTANSLQAIH
jgi:hypothetical protein